MKAEKQAGKINWEDHLKEIGKNALESAAGRKVTAEAFLLYERELSLEVTGGEVKHLKQAEQAGLGIRILKGDRLGFAFTTDLSARAVSQTVAHAVSMADYVSADHYNILPHGNFTYPAMKTYDPAIASVALEEKIALARRMEQSARSCDKRVTVVERSAYNDNEFTCVIMNTEGVCASGQGNFCGLHIYLLAEQDGEAQSGFAVNSSHFYSSLCPQNLGVEAAVRAVRSLGARSIVSAHLPCVMEPTVTARFLTLLSQLVDAGAVHKNKSMFAGKIDQKVASPVFNLVDDGLDPVGIGAFPFDSEGVPGGRTVLIQNGILKSYLYDTYNANKAGRKSTGNAQRSSFRALPAVGTTNFMVLPGDKPPQNFITDIDKGLYITDVMGMHTANPISGDFSLGAAGIMIEKGKLTFPVRGITIAGNLGQFLLDIEAVGNDLRFFGSRGASTIRLKSLSIGGE